MAGRESSLRVLQVGSSLNDWGGIERYIVYLSQGLADRGHEVTVTCPPGSPLASKLSCEVIGLSVRRKLDVRALSRYLKLFRGSRFDVVQLHFSPDFLVAGLAAKWTRQSKVVMTRHVAIPWNGFKRTQYLSLVDCIVPASEAVRSVLLESGVPSTMLRMAKAGCPALVPTEGRESNDFAFGVFGRLVREKGVDVAVRASGLSGQPLHVFGEGPLKSELEALAASLTAPVTFHGFMEGVADAMNAVDAVVIPSRWAEAFPFAALEAMSLGKPLLVSDRGGLPEMVGDGSNGFLFPSEDARSLADLMSRLASDQALATDLGKAGKRRHAEEFTVEKFAQRMERVYR